MKIRKKRIYHSQVTDGLEKGEPFLPNQTDCTGTALTFASYSKSPQSHWPITTHNDNLMNQSEVFKLNSCTGPHAGSITHIINVVSRRLDGDTYHELVVQMIGQ